MVTLGEGGFITADTYTLEDPLSLITNQPKRIGILKRLIRQTSWVLQGAQEMRKTNDELIKNKDATFFAKVKGQSMIDAGLDDNDLLVIDEIWLM